MMPKEENGKQIEKEYTTHTIISLRGGALHVLLPYLKRMRENGWLEYKIGKIVMEDCEAPQLWRVEYIQYVSCPEVEARKLRGIWIEGDANVTLNVTPEFEDSHTTNTPLFHALREAKA